MTSSAEAYIGRYPHLDFRRAVWREIVDYVRRDAGDAESVLELGPGYCDFINQIPARKKVAFDLNPEMRLHAGPDVDFRVGDAKEALRELPPETFDLVFASNFLEHLDLEDAEVMVQSARRVLRPHGRLILIQPNYARCARNYFDDPTHRTIFTDENIVDLLTKHQIRVLKIVPGFLPFSMRSRLPKWPILTRLYLRSPVKPLAAQMYVVATRT